MRALVSAACRLGGLVALLVALTVGPAQAANVGVHWDVEPAATPEWRAGGSSQAQVATGFLNLMAQMQRMADAAGITMSVDVPNQFATVTVAYKGQTKNMFGHLLGVGVKDLLLMDYRNYASSCPSTFVACPAPEDSIISHARALLSTVTAYNAAHPRERKAVVGIGVETDELTDQYAYKTTFFGTTPAFLEKALGETVRVLAPKYTAFTSLAVHHARSYRAFVGATPPPATKYCRSLWHWDHEGILNNRVEREAAVNFAYKQGVNKLILYCQGTISDRNTWPTLRQLIYALASADIQFECMFDNADLTWYAPGGDAQPTQLMQSFLAFRSTLEPARIAMARPTPRHCILPTAANARAVALPQRSFLDTNSHATSPQASAPQAEQRLSLGSRRSARPRTRPTVRD